MIFPWVDLRELTTETFGGCFSMRCAALSSRVGGRRGGVGAVIVLGLALALGAGGSTPTASAKAGVPPVVQRTATTATTDALPTVQINGVVKTQVVVGNTVYAAGEFSSARPAGAAAGTSEVPRANLLAYDIRTGKLITSFAPKLNAAVKGLAVSTDKKTLFVVGNFTKVGGSTRNRFAAFDVASGGLKKMAPDFNYVVTSATVTASNVYVAGGFTSVNGKKRLRLAAVSASTGALASWAPSVDQQPSAIVATPNQSMIVVGGQFTKLNSTTAIGMGALDAKSGATKTWKVNTVVQNSGSKSAILSLAVDKDTVYGSGYAYGGGNFEGVFAASPSDGTIKWLQDCHGDTYSVAPVGNYVYSVGHAHYCKNIGGFPDTNPRKAWYRALAVTKATGGTVATNGQAGAHYGDFGGQPAPSLVNWFPELQPGTYTGQTQSAWSVAATSSYVLLGGEFTQVNGVAQQGLVRLGVPSKAPDKQGPMVTGAGIAPQLGAAQPNAATLSWTANWDRDDTALTYELLRDDTVVSTQTANSQFWNLPTLTATDTGLAAGTSYSYQVRVRDADGNTVTSPSATVQTTSSAAYADRVRADGTSHQWRISGGSSAADPDRAGSLDLGLGTGVTLGATGAIRADTDGAGTFDGSETGAVTGEETASAKMSAELWFKTTQGGASLLRFGTAADTDHAASYPRSLSLSGDGRLTFTTGDDPSAALTGSASYADGAWHQVVAVQSTTAVKLYVDGVQVGSAGVSPTVSGSGRWWVGSGYTGTIDDVAIYRGALTAGEVAQHLQLARQ